MVNAQIPISPFKAAGWADSPIAACLGLFAPDGEIVQERRSRCVGSDGHVEVFVDQEIVAGRLADDAEVVHKCGGEREAHDVGNEPGARHAGTLIFVAGYRSCAGDSLWLKLKACVDVVGVHLPGHQHM